MAFIPPEFILQLHSSIDICDLIGGYVQLRSHGSTSTGLCPFHNEKTPSFTVYSNNQSFYCFGCGEGGDAISFVMKRENLEYVEAVRFLAERAGLPMPDAGDDSDVRTRRRILDANREAARFFFSELNSEAGKNCRAYLRKRGLSDAVIKRFGIGFAAERGDRLKRYLTGKGFRENELVEAGLCSSTDSGRTFDFFRNRVMFPVIDVRGNVIAFSGRTLGDDSRKYLNTRDTLVFKKSRTLFAINIAHNTKGRRFVVAEGQMDVIAIHQAGVDCAVAAMGTALTEEHARIIGQYADEVVLCYDADEAGQKATRRAIDVFKNTKIVVKVIEIEGAKDPDEYIQKKGADHFRTLLDESGNSTEYMLDREALKYDVETDAGRNQYLRRAAEILASIPSPIERDIYASRIVRQFGNDKQSLITEIEQIRARGAWRKKRQDEQKLMDDVKRPDRPGSGPPAAKPEERMIALLLKNPSCLRRVMSKVSVKDFTSAENASIFESLCNAIADSTYSDSVALNTILSPDERKSLARIIAVTDNKPISPDDINLIAGQIKKSQMPADSTVRNMDPDRIQEMLGNLKKDGVYQ